MVFDEHDDQVTVLGVQCIRATAMAILVLIPSGGSRAPREQWIPQSVIDDDSEVFAQGDVGKLVVKGWWGRKEGLE